MSLLVLLQALAIGGGLVAPHARQHLLHELFHRVRHRRRLVDLAQRLRIVDKRLIRPRSVEERVAVPRVDPAEGELHEQTEELIETKLDVLGIGPRVLGRCARLPLAVILSVRRQHAADRIEVKVARIEQRVAR